jgi:hypothetical protein
MNNNPNFRTAHTQAIWAMALTGPKKDHRRYFQLRRITLPAPMPGDFPRQPAAARLSIPASQQAA